MKWAGHYASLVSASTAPSRSPTLHTNSQVVPSQTVFQILKDCIRKEERQILEYIKQGAREARSSGVQSS